MRWRLSPGSPSSRARARSWSWPSAPAGSGASGVRLDPLVLRYVWPSELDLMARLAGLSLRVRHGGWSGEPFDGRSLRHVSVYACDA
jgi:hypothetical protein